MRLPAALVATAAALTLAACGGTDEEDGAAGTTAAAPAAAATTGTFDDPATIATGLEVPWGVAFLPGGDALVAERDTARILRIPSDGGEPELVRELEGVRPDGEGGLLGLAVDPRDEGADPWVYAFHTAEEDNRIVRFRLAGDDAPEVLLDGMVKAGVHNGGRLAFGPDGLLYAGAGDAGDPSLAQDPSSLNGKVLRIAPDGSIPAGNPIDGSPVFTLGHRNPQGLAFDADGRLWQVEFGQNDVDEVNLLKAGANYGWPDVEGTGAAPGSGFTDPQVTWPTSEASPSGAAVVDGVLHVAALRGERLWRVPIDGDRLGTPEAVWTERFGRLRTAIATPDGGLWVTTSNRDGRGDPAGEDDRILAVTDLAG